MFLARRPGDDAVIGLELQRELLAHFRSLAFFSRQEEGNHEGRERSAVTTCVANSQTTCVAYIIATTRAIIFKIIFFI